MSQKFCIWYSTRREVQGGAGRRQRRVRTVRYCGAALWARLARALVEAAATLPAEVLQYSPALVAHTYRPPAQYWPRVRTTRATLRGVVLSEPTGCPVSHARHGKGLSAPNARRRRGLDAQEHAHTVVTTAMKTCNAPLAALEQQLREVRRNGLSYLQSVMGRGRARAAKASGTARWVKGGVPVGVKRPGNAKRVRGAAFRIDDASAKVCSRPGAYRVARVVLAHAETTLRAGLGRDV
ncbi:hypothetical protein EXIGLDRAFT_320930 [Exidia glandulosa HHB12029]|uniref:Uncharacterized protein n=1 Tax=Exidia glandulosa HHB12029 TaxID=1314781 RepID=A0A165Q607_EXIGL|nr:hypothetical protein EXIGLDRAFT_320930 [Exidia glandulosa HHB12029]